MKEIIDKLDFIKMKKNFHSMNDNVKRLRQATERENIYAKDTSDRGLLPKIYKGPLKLKNNKTNNLI